MSENLESNETELSSTFLRGGGDMGERIRAYDWARNPLGAPHGWPAGLRTAVRIMLTTNHPMFIFWGPQSICLYNDAYRRSLGPEKHPSILGAIGRDAWSEIWPIIGPQIEQVLGGGEATWHENQLVPITRHGELAEVYWTYSYGPIDDETSPNGIGGVLVVCNETTAQVLAEQHMRAAEARWRALFDQAPSFMCVLEGPEFRYEYANPGYLRLIGTTNVIGKTVLEALPELRSQGYFELLEHVYRSGEVYVARGAPLLLSNSQGLPPKKLFVDFVYQPIRDWRGVITGIFVAGSDVTERIEADKLLAEADRRKDEFLATLSHELRNPLAPIRNAANILHTPGAGATQREWAVNVIDRQVQAMARLLDDLLDISRITQGRVGLFKQRVSLVSVVDAALEVARPAIDARQHEVSIQLPANAVEVELDALRFSQALSNLLINAAKYTDKGGHIALSAEVNGEMLRIAVKDSGIGLASESLGSVFEMFSQVGSARDRSEGGLGIGLALVKGIVELHGGRVEASSAGLGYGSEFVIEVPVRPV